MDKDELSLLNPPPPSRSPSLNQINWISIISPYLILIDSDHVFLPATRELMRVKFTLKRDSADYPSPKLKLVKIIWREGA